MYINNSVMPQIVIMLSFKISSILISLIQRPAIGYEEYNHKTENNNPPKQVLKIHVNINSIILPSFIFITIMIVNHRSCI